MWLFCRAKWEEMADPGSAGMTDGDEERGDNSQDYSSESADGSNDYTSENSDSSSRGNDVEDDDVSDVVIICFCFIAKTDHYNCYI